MIWNAVPQILDTPKMSSLCESPIDKTFEYPSGGRVESCLDETNDLESAIAKGAKSGLLGNASDIGLFEASTTYKLWEPSLDDEKILERLETVRSAPAGHIRTRTFFIPWAKCDRTLAVTPVTLTRICSILHVPALFIDGIMEEQYWITPGNGLFLSHGEDGNPTELDFFYRYSYGLRGARAYIFTKYNFVNNATTNICINLIPEARTRWTEKDGIQVGLSTLGQPLALHTLLISHALQYWNKDGIDARQTLLYDELDRQTGSPKVRAVELHSLAQKLHILLEDFNSLEEKILFLIKVYETYNEVTRHLRQPSTKSEEKYMLEYLLSKSSHSKRWIGNYRDRANIRINLAFHLSTQVDNELNVQISKATTAIARDAQRDSSSMITIAAVTMFFLPGTFISAVFSMVFFNFQQDSNGYQELQVSDRWWYFLAATIPLTCVVFIIWILWQRFRFRRHQIEDETSKYAVNDLELEVFGDDRRNRVHSWGSH